MRARAFDTGDHVNNNSCGFEVASEWYAGGDVVVSGVLVTQHVEAVGTFRWPPSVPSAQ